MLKQEKLQRFLDFIKPKQGIYIGRVKVDPVYGVIGIAALYFAVQSESVERFIYWVEIKAQEMTYERDLSNDPMGVMKENLIKYASNNKSENPIEVFLDGVTTFKYLETSFRVSFSFEPLNMSHCRLSMIGRLNVPSGPVSGKHTKLEIWCTKNSRETKISTVAPTSFQSLPVLEDQPLLVRFAIDAEDEGYKMFLDSFNNASNLQKSEQIALDVEDVQDVGPIQGDAN